MSNGPIRIEEERNLVRETSRSLYVIARALGPGAFCGAIANAIGPMTDAEWAEFVAGGVAPCGAPDCDCEKLRIPMFAALAALRADWQEQTADFPV